MYRVFFFTGEHTTVEADSEEEAIDIVWHFTSAPIEKMEPIDGDSLSAGRPHQEDA